MFAAIIEFIGARWIHFVAYPIIGLIIWGIYNKVFVQPTNSNSTKIANIEKQVNVYDSPKEPIFGCAAWRVNTEVYYKKQINGKQKEGK